jgi:shikimate dehydrogenase
VPRLGVLGWPVAHSRSPAMHAAAFAALGMHDWRYQRLPVPPELFAQTTRALGAVGFLGANVTIPHKQAALSVADEASAVARAVGAANTLMFASDGSIRAENTDAPGLVAALPRPAAGATAQVLGAGGSARAAVWSLIDAGAREVTVWNRTPARARALAAEFGARAVERPVPADILVNCTSVELEDWSSAAGALRAMGLTLDELETYPFVVDLVYRDGTTWLLHAARERAAQVVDGLEVLVQQGALSFELWTGVAGPIEAMRDGAAMGTEATRTE